MRRREAGKRRTLLPAVALALALVPSALGAPPQAEAPATPAPQALPDPDPTRLALAPPDLLADALRVGFERRFAALEASPAPVSSPPPEAPETATLLGPELAVAASVPEPPSVWLGLLSLASAAVASRGTPRCPRRRRHR
jgi:hypothetical protein